MNFLRTSLHIVLEALFPLSKEEKELALYTPEKAFEILPRLADAPLAGLAVDMDHARAIFSYTDERIRKLIWNIKYKKSVHCATLAGYALYTWIENTSKPRPNINTLDITPLSILTSSSCQVLTTHPCQESGPILLIPMPITGKRCRERGYNQCEIITDEIEKLDTEKLFTYNKDILVRTSSEGEQKLKDRSDRVAGTKGIFTIDNKRIEELGIENLKKYSVFIIDDVITTGSTMKEAVDTLKEAGFVDVRGLGVAH